MHTLLSFILATLFLFKFSSGANEFNFEISQHVVNVVQKIMDSGTWVPHFAKNYFESGYADAHDVDRAGSLFFFLLKSNVNARNVYCAYEDGSFLSVIRGSSTIPVLKTTFNLTGEYMWSYRPPGVNQSRSYYETDNFGKPTTFLTSQVYDPRVRPWYIAAKEKNTSLWYGPLVFISYFEAGLTYCLPMYYPNGTLDGILALDFALLDISTFLEEQYAGTDREVFIVDMQGTLIGSSTGTDLLVPGGTLSMVTANSSSDPLLTKIYHRLAANRFEDGLVIVDKSYVQTASLRDNTTSLDWKIWVSMPATPSKDFLVYSDPGAIPVLVISALACAISVVASGLVFWHREAKIIRMSQRRLVGTFLLGCLLLNLSFIAYLGPNTLEACRFRSWWPNLMFTVAFSPILIKTWYMYGMFTKKMRDIRSNVHPRFSRDWWKARFVGLTARTLGLILLQVIILLCSTFTGEMDPYDATLLGADGAYQTRTFCGPNGEAAFNILNLIYKILMVACGCGLAYATRHISSFLAESYSLAVIVYSISVFGLIILLITETANLEVETSFLMRTIGVCWSTTVSTIALLGPRFYKLFTIGDEAAMQWLRKGPLSEKGPGSAHGSVNDSKIERHTIQTETGVA